MKHVSEMGCQTFRSTCISQAEGHAQTYSDTPTRDNTPSTNLVSFLGVDVNQNEIHAASINVHHTYTTFYQNPSSICRNELRVKNA